MEYRLVLDYSLTAGRLNPWIAALRQGTAAALSCNQCGKVSFPPERRCTCGSIQSTWVELPGTASIIERSDGDSLSLALARFDGADSLAIVRLRQADETRERGRLAAVPDGEPALVLLPEPEDDRS